MQFQVSLIVAAILAILGSASTLPRDCEVLDVDNEPYLREAGQIVFEPLAFDGESEFGMDGDTSILEDWKTSIVRQHNEYRAQYGAKPLTWSDALYPGASQWASQCKFQHSDGQGKYGENLAAGTGNSYGFSSGLKSWMDEASKYDYNHPGFSSTTGHFTQVVWKSSKQVACAIASCRGGTIFQQPSKYVVCRYSPAGNFAGQFPENVGKHR
ncbi:PR-1 protein [Guyanagaster necrorhizus]|uniref:PR-1 protein n=1 Tax=Guyanagaster necrorhizus TaxID=856835 RepID=A0A9P7W6R0_9AGAR|nr:PR-1 protein [Guyanagaster necrorhizus MCA 3950]KAG7453158.1 PR-1 protein [Guyanagaster necrorhizus MCA 3950]